MTQTPEPEEEIPAYGVELASLELHHPLSADDRKDIVRWLEEVVAEMKTAPDWSVSSYILHEGYYKRRKKRR